MENEFQRQIKIQKFEGDPLAQNSSRVTLWEKFSSSIIPPPERMIFYFYKRKSSPRATYY